MTIYMSAPYSWIFHSRHAAMTEIRDLFIDSAEALAAYDARCDLLAEDDYTPEEIQSVKEDPACLEEWAAYTAFDLIDEAEASGRSDLYGVTIYAHAETEALEERVTDMIDPYCGEDARVATFCALFDAADLVSDIVEYIVNELDSPETVDELAARVRLIDDIRAYRKARRAGAAI